MPTKQPESYQFRYAVLTKTVAFTREKGVQCIFKAVSLSPNLVLIFVSAVGGLIIQHIVELFLQLLQFPMLLGFQPLLNIHKLLLS